MCCNVLCCGGVLQCVVSRILVCFLARCVAFWLFVLRGSSGVCFLSVFPVTSVVFQCYIGLFFVLRGSEMCCVEIILLF